MTRSSLALYHSDVHANMFRLIVSASCQVKTFLLTLQFLDLTHLLSPLTHAVDQKIFNFKTSHTKKIVVLKFAISPSTSFLNRLKVLVMEACR